ncbi:MAG: hypothetical protein VW226_10255 [Rhodospirillaceae bacterium]
MSQIRLILILAFCLSHHSYYVQAGEKFLSIIDDIPLAEGLVEKPKTIMIFDSSDGIISEIRAEGVARVSSIMKFYANSLPQLGWEAKLTRAIWRPEGKAFKSLWERGLERLLIEVKAVDGSAEVGFVLTTFNKENR